MARHSIIFIFVPPLLLSVVPHSVPQFEGIHSDVTRSTWPSRTYIHIPYFILVAKQL